MSKQQTLGRHCRSVSRNANPEKLIVFLFTRSGSSRFAASDSDFVLVIVILSPLSLACGGWAVETGALCSVQGEPLRASSSLKLRHFVSFALLLYLLLLCLEGTAVYGFL